MRKLNGFDVSMTNYGVKNSKNFGNKINDIMAEHLVGKSKKLQLSNFGALKRFVVDKIIKYQSCYPYIAG